MYLVFYSHGINRSQHLCILWTRSTLPLTFEMSRSWQIISKTAQKMRNSSLSLCGMYFKLLSQYLIDRKKLPRNDMFELSHRLIGIYKTSNATRSKLHDVFALESRLTNPWQVSLSIITPFKPPSQNLGLNLQVLKLLVSYIFNYLSGPSFSVFRLYTIIICYLGT